MKRMRWSPIALILTILWPSHGWTCECAAGVFGATRPIDGAVDVPINTRVWISAQAETRILVDGVDVAFTETGVPFFRVLTPLEPLPADQEVRVELPPTSGLSSFTFRTSANRDDTPPEPPRLTHFTSWSVPGLPTCYFPGAPVISVATTIEGEGDIFFADLDADSALDGTLNATTDTASLGRQIGFSTLCDRLTPRPFLQARYASVDLAGNFSGWSESYYVPIPPAGVIGCESAGGYPGAVVVVALGLRRRRRRGLIKGVTDGSAPVNGPLQRPEVSPLN